MLIRRYTPPTCTLEIIAKRSPLARLWGKTLVDELRFELRFDDPRQIQEEPPIVRGDREQLDRLCDVVTAYVQDFLLQSSAANLPLLSAIPLAVNHSPVPEDLPLSGTLPHLQPQGLLFHELALGQLAAENVSGIVSLSATQLFDLAAALDEYSSEIDRLPSTRSSSLPVVPVWGKVAALLMVTAGLATAIVRFSPLPQTQLEVASSPESDSLATAPVEPLPPLPEPPPLPQPDFPDELSGRAPLTPPPTVTAPRVPNAPIFIPGPPRPLNQSRPRNAPSPLPPEEESEIAPIAPPEAPVLPDLPAVTEEGQRQQDSALETILPPERLATVPTQPKASREAPQDFSSPFPPASITPSASSPLAPPSSPAPPSPSLSRSSATRALERQEEAIESFDRPSDSGALEDRNIELEPVEPPRVSQVRSYFQQRWQPPENLPTALEYRLHLAGDGSLERIIPLGETARTYLERAPVPQLGKPFVMPDPNYQTLKVDLILGIDGSVQTRWESSE
ncbi:MAG: DUF4335 domain-containing protein [Cyanobacteria bacterium SBLK]|nr:DUF4335 domain-containing protein [Cyanobacteria bacterium SBLK]